MIQRKTIVTCSFVGFLTCVTCCEWASQSCFNKSLENLKIGTSNIADLKKGFVDQRPLATGIPIDELEHYIEGFAWRSHDIDEPRDSKWVGSGEAKAPKRKSVVVRWPSLIGCYKVLLSMDFRDRVTEFVVMSASDED